jgi:hypothetical protein
MPYLCPIQRYSFPSYIYKYHLFYLFIPNTNIYIFYLKLYLVITHDPNGELTREKSYQYLFEELFLSVTNLLLVHRLFIS